MPNVRHLEQLPDGAVFRVCGTGLTGVVVARFGSSEVKVQYTDRDGTDRTAGWAPGAEVVCLSTPDQPEPNRPESEESVSYRCEACCGKVPPGVPRKVHVVYRPDGQIAREIPVCGRCAGLLAQGARITDLRRELGPELPPQVREVVKPPPPAPPPEAFVPPAPPSLVRTRTALKQPPRFAPAREVNGK